MCFSLALVGGVNVEENVRRSFDLTSRTVIGMVWYGGYLGFAVVLVESLVLYIFDAGFC